MKMKQFNCLKEFITDLQAEADIEQKLLLVEICSALL